MSNACTVDAECGADWTLTTTTGQEIATLKFSEMRQMCTIEDLKVRCRQILCLDLNAYIQLLFCGKDLLEDTQSIDSVARKTRASTAVEILVVVSPHEPVVVVNVTPPGISPGATMPQGPPTVVDTGDVPVDAIVDFHYGTSTCGQSSLQLLKKTIRNQTINSYGREHKNILGGSLPTECIDLFYYPNALEEKMQLTKDNTLTVLEAARGGTLAVTGSRKGFRPGHNYYSPESVGERPPAEELKGHVYLVVVIRVDYRDIPRRNNITSTVLWLEPYRCFPTLGGAQDCAKEATATEDQPLLVLGPLQWQKTHENEVDEVIQETSSCWGHLFMTLDGTFAQESVKPTADQEFWEAYWIGSTVTPGKTGDGIFERCKIPSQAYNGAQIGVFELKAGTWHMTQESETLGLKDFTDAEAMQKRKDLGKGWGMLKARFAELKVAISDKDDLDSQIWNTKQRVSYVAKDYAERYRRLSSTLEDIERARDEERQRLASWEAVEIPVKLKKDLAMALQESAQHRPVLSKGALAARWTDVEWVFVKVCNVEQASHPKAPRPSDDWAFQARQLLEAQIGFTFPGYDYEKCRKMLIENMQAWLQEQGRPADLSASFASSDVPWLDVADWMIKQGKPPSEWPRKANPTEEDLSL